jgi:Reverse transcriptase (RNA-dependent DNA polymerase)
MARMVTAVNDVKRAFLNDKSLKNKSLYMELPEGFERFYQNNVVLLWLKGIYGIKQAAFKFWLELLNTAKAMELKRINADPCLYFRWTNNGLNL